MAYKPTKICEMEILKNYVENQKKKNKSQFHAIFYVKCKLLIQYIKKYLSEIYLYQRIGLQPRKEGEIKLYFSFIVGHPVFTYWIPMNQSLKTFHFGTLH